MLLIPYTLRVTVEAILHQTTIQQGKGSSPAVDVVQTHPGLDARRFLVLLRLPLREHPTIQSGILNTGLFSGTAKERWLITLITHYCNLNSSLPSAIYKWSKTSGISLKLKEPTGTQHQVETEGWEIPKLFSCLLAVLRSFAFESVKQNHCKLEPFFKCRSWNWIPSTGTTHCP